MLTPGTGLNVSSVTLPDTTMAASLKNSSNAALLFPGMSRYAPPESASGTIRERSEGGINVMLLRLILYVTFVPSSSLFNTETIS
jgi:hypothetical protein